MDQLSNKGPIRFLSFSDDKEDAEKQAKLKEAALKIEQAIQREKSLNELVDYNPNEEHVDTLPADLANDNRPLYERLLEQKNKKQEAVEESQKLSNLITTLDEEDADYLNEVARQKYEDEERKRIQVLDVLGEKRRLDEQRQIDEERQKKESLMSTKLTAKSPSLKTKLSSMIKIKPKTSQSRVQITSTSRETAEQDRTQESMTNDNMQSDDTQARKRWKSDREDQQADAREDADSSEGDRKTCQNNCATKQVARCIGILPALPIVARMDNSSDDSNSSDDLSAQPMMTRIHKK